MRETPAGFGRRGGSYAPPAWLRAEARPLGPRESCPTLFRYPGPEGLQALLRGGLRRLAPEGVERVWLVERATAERGQAVRLFGTLAVLEPLRLHPCATRRAGVFLGVNRHLGPELPLVWVPPSALQRELSWDRIRSREQAERRFGSGLAEERERVAESLAGYLEELSALERAAAAPADRPWLALPARERRARLAAAGLAPRWTRG